ncbi:succinyl-diaminopimelate desuccinylase [Cordyceps fumosorosea ARSEF 2679]|uniref:Succinyl-diaminopimelate desuccinylase n=1 Tax=Cordyceps fumosorosea (strain ARSEF 2679) TaxID=1081104 RepID=A0A167N5B0_CORFA|nr:succinyl-diaminopimelate desuccinylase [Cordyceps fumosorosea ARSEF 2679]OAA55144.1 succinyl-diaminopimelate desuccinylase [Cordyceps fumosorosea ARSEF 2679]
MDFETQLRDEIAANAQSILSLTQELVRTPSTNPPGDVSAVASVAADQIRKLIPESDISTVETGPGITNVVVVIRSGRHGKRLIFSGHLDTYPTGDAAGWALDPFSGQLSNDGKYIYGRGVSDMKGGIAASVVAAQALARCKERWSGDVVIALAGDEETMGTLGTAHLLTHVADVGEADAMICGDAGSPLIVRAGEKGLLWLEVEASGKPAHGAHVHRGSSAIDRLMVALSELKSLEKLEITAPTEVKEATMAAKPVSEPLGGAGEAAVLGSVTVNIGKISGGTSTNLVAETASASLDIRLPMGLSTVTLIEEMKRKLEKIDGVRYQVVRAYEPSWTPPDEEITRHALEVTRLVVDERAVVNMRVGASDARLFRAAGIPSVVIGLTPHNMGAPDEHVEVAELMQVAQIHALTAYRFLKS